jgi:hypothetical protein
MLTIRQKHKRIVEIMCCTSVSSVMDCYNLLPSEITEILCVSVILTWKKREDKESKEKDSKVFNSDGSYILIYCCFVDAALGCRCSTYAEKVCPIDSRFGSTCCCCKQWFCSDHYDWEGLKCCTLCGTQLFGKLDKVDVFDVKNTIDYFFKKNGKKELESYNAPIHGSGQSCSHTNPVDPYNFSQQTFQLCDNSVIKFCSDCGLGFCDSHSDGFCYCGRPVTLKE